MIDCLPKLHLVPHSCQVEVRGTCGYEPPRRVARGAECLDLPETPSRCWARFGANEAVTPAHFSPRACEPFRKIVTATFGSGGCRMLSGPRSRGSPAGNASALADYGALPDALAAEVVGRAPPTMAGRLAAGMREIFNWRPSEAFRSNAKAVSDDQEAYAARQAAEAEEKRK